MLKVTVTSFRRSIYGLENVAKELREFILLSDMLIYCKVGRKDLQYRGYILAGSMLIQDGDRTLLILPHSLRRSLTHSLTRLVCCSIEITIDFLSITK